MLSSSSAIVSQPITYHPPVPSADPVLPPDTSRSGGECQFIQATPLCRAIAGGSCEFWLLENDRQSFVINILGSFDRTLFIQLEFCFFVQKMVELDWSMGSNDEVNLDVFVAIKFRIYFCSFCETTTPKHFNLFKKSTKLRTFFHLVYFLQFIQ